MTHVDSQVSLAGLTWTDADGLARTTSLDSAAWYAWLAEPAHKRLLFEHPALGRFILRQERKQRGGWYWSMYRRFNGRLRKVYLGKGEQLSFQRLQSAAYALATGSVAQHGAPVAGQLPTHAPLLDAKLVPPPLRPHAVARPHALAQLTAAIERPLTLVIAPAGMGKTSLLTAWLNQVDTKGRMQDTGAETDTHPSSFILHPFKAAWLSLDLHDNDPLRFLGYLCAACERLHPTVGAVAAGLLHALQMGSAEAVLTPLLNGLGAAEGVFVLVLDDYHLIHNQAIHDVVIFILDHQPPNVRLVIVGRSEPPLPLPRLRVRGQLSELGRDDLRFSDHEAHQFLTECMGLALTSEQAALLAQRAEGWVAGLYLAALVAARSAKGVAALADISGSQRDIVDYLATEVFADQPEPVQRFLLRTAVLDRLCGPLCATLLGASTDHASSSIAQAQSTLEALDRGNLFLVPLDTERRWYRYHQLFSDFLRDRLERTAPDVLGDLHRRAANWYAGEGLLVEAVDHALAADATLAATFVERWGRDLLMRGAVTTVLGWIERLPSALVTSRSHLNLIAAWALTAAGRLDAAAMHLDAAEEVLDSVSAPREFAGEVLAARAAIAGLQRDLVTAVALSQAALAHLSPAQGYVRSVVCQLLGGAAHANGDAHGASRALAEALQLGHASGNLFITIFSTRQLADVRVMQGRCADAEQLYQQILGRQAGGGPALLDLPVAGMAAVGLGELYYRRNALAAAADLIEGGLAAGERGQDIEIIVRGSLALARVRVAAGDSAATQDLLGRARSTAGRSGTPWLEAWATAEAARSTLLMGDLSGALIWAKTCGLSLDDPPSYLYEHNYLALARVILAQPIGVVPADELLAVEHMLARFRADAERSGRIASQIEIAILEALTFQRIGDPAQAVATLERALQLGHPDDYIRVYLDGGATVGALLWRLLRGNTLTAELRAATVALHRMFGTQSARQLPDSPEFLTARELDVMTLLVAGRTNQEIAQALIISLGTVKKHLSNLYSKLGAGSRTEAIARVRALGIVP